MKEQLIAVAKRGALVVWSFLVCMALLPATEVKAATNTGLIRIEGHEITKARAEELSEAFAEENGIDSLGSKVYNSEWDVYSTNYYYNMLNSTERAVWDSLDAGCRTFMNSTQNAAYDSIDGIYYLEAGTNNGLTNANVKKVILLFKYSNPQYYFLGTSISWWTYGSIFIEVQDQFANGNTRATTTAEFKSCIAPAVVLVKAQGNDYLKIKKAHDWIIKNIAYAPKNDVDNPLYQVAYSVFRTNKQYTVCAGYSQAFELLMNAVGIDCIAETSDTHEWNMVKLYGYWYYIDLTWDDPYDTIGSTYVDYDYFNRDLTHILSGNDSHVAEDFYSGIIPSTSKDSGGSSADVYTKATVKGSEPYLLYNAGKVSITVPTGYTVYYTTDGVDPSETYSKSYRITSSTTISVPSSGIVKAVSVKQGLLNSAIASKTISFYTITYSANGKTYKTAKYAQGVVPAKPSNPSKTGYTFNGWYTNSGLTSAYTFKNGLTSNITVYAKFTAKTYKYTFKANGSGAYINKKGTTSLKKTYTFGKVFKNLPTAKRANYAFLGWYTKKSGGQLITSADTVSKAKNMTLYAHWSKIKTSKAKISSLKSTKSGTMTVKIKKISYANGYQIRYSLKSSMKSAKKTSTYDSATSKTIAKLKSGKTYYVQVRMYQKNSVNGKVTYGSWSATKKVKVK